MHYNPQTGKFTRVPHINPNSYFISADIIKITEDIYEVVDCNGEKAKLLGYVFLNDGNLVYEEFQYDVILKPKETLPPGLPDTTPTPIPVYE